MAGGYRDDGNHHALNFDAYTTSYAVFIGATYVAALLALYYIAVDGLRARFVLAYAGIVTLKVALAYSVVGWARGDESQIWEFIDAAHALYAQSPLAYTLMHDAGAFLAIAGLVRIVQLRNRLDDTPD